MNFIRTAPAEYVNVAAIKSAKLKVRPDDRWLEIELMDGKTTNIRGDDCNKAYDDIVKLGNSN